MSLARQRSVSNRLETPQLVLPKGKDVAMDSPFEPCAATASHFLFSQGSTILVLHHDTLALERRFTTHTEAIALISVDNVSERGQGRLVVTYDIGKTAIIWDLFTGEQLSRFASYEPLLVASWMRNGNIAFGNEKGEVILFEPSTSEHISARTINDPITALAPSSDCKTYALGFRNGSILLAALQPQFTILHTLNTSRSPSPIAMLSWHASSSKQKSDMLAIQNSDGDLRVWSVPKPPTAGQPRVIRVLRRVETAVQGRNWCSWSRNGRIIQFSEGETWAWDVRTKDVNYYPVPTIEYVNGIAAHGPTAALFTLGPEYTVQQYDVDQGQMVANIRHTPITIPPTPPEDYIKQFHAMTEQELTSPLQSLRYEGENQKMRIENPASPHSHSVSTSSRKSNSTKPNIHDLVSPAKTERTATTFSQGAYASHYHPQSAQPISPAVAGPARASPSLKKGSRLRQEVVMSPMTPEDGFAGDLFPVARQRLSQVQQPMKPINESSMTPDDLRKHMLALVFGWEDDIYALVADERSQHPPESLAALFLTKWLEDGAEAVAETMSSTAADPGLDWIRLAIGILDNRPESKKIGQIFVEKMLSKGEVHAAVVTLVALGEKNDAIEVYVSNNWYLEAILLTCLLMPQEWQRQAHLVRRWGEHVVENSQQQLAIRCFAATGVEPAEAWVSPTAQFYGRIISPQSAILYQPPSIPPQSQQTQQAHQPQHVPQPQQLSQQHYQPPEPSIQLQPLSAINPHISRIKGRGFEAATPVALIAPPTPFRTAAAKGTRITPQTGGLKLITSFNNRPNHFKFPGLKTDDMTPTNAANITPIAESALDRSALSPGGVGSYKLNNIQSLNNAIASTSGLSRARLPSIGETPLESEETPVFPSRHTPHGPLTPADSSSDKEKEKRLAARVEPEKQEPRQEKQEPSLTLLTSARYEPSSTPTQSNNQDFEPQTALRPSSQSTWQSSLDRVREESHTRNGSRGRKPDGLSIQMLNSSEPIPRPSTTESTNTNFALSPLGTGDSLRMKSPSVSGRSIDQYISSLDQAQYYGKARSRNSSRAPKEEKSERKKSKHRKQKHSEDAHGREVANGKRSPSSPVPMSPEDVQDMRHYTNSMESLNSLYDYRDVVAKSGKHGRRTSASTNGTGKVRHRSRSAQAKFRAMTKEPEAEETLLSRRGRSRSRKENSESRSPSSPLPMLASEEENSSDPAFRFVSQNRSRLQRSTSRRPERGTSARRDASPDRRRGRPRSPSRQRDYETRTGQSSTQIPDDIRDSDELSRATIEKLNAMTQSMRGSPGFRSRTRELAQAELEARRLSLARRPAAPTIPLPGHVNAHSKSSSDGFAAVAPPLNRNYTDSVLRSAKRTASRQEQQGRPGTPQAMHAPLEELQHETSESFQLPARTYSANAIRENVEAWRANAVPENMPRHPAFNHQVKSRGNSRSRTRAESSNRQRNLSREENMILAEDVQPLIVGYSDESETAEHRVSIGPTVIPELQHLAVPPPPPPPPAPPRDLRIQTDLSNIAAIPLPRSAYPTNAELSSATPDKPHRRVPSRNGEGGQLMGKIRGMIRSSSKPRDNFSRSPNADDGIMSPYETVTMMPPPLSTMNGGR
ncbi:hypothetical protein LTR05_004938 [Lithohypha guttulata]|uniref:Gem-associated protein 5 TPR domain-containing protein n=1 Tax=Lithohypha guttulata TaxID=1690604 RepID=A0AAN7YAT8_9EURO|nr:hypothetical protein LTR05_004938 [Lithohypha guttulata]